MGDNTMLNNMTKCDLMLVLLRDFHNDRSAAIRCDRLAAVLDLQPKQVQRLVHKLRHEGHPICRDEDGYFYASCSEDIECTARWLMTLGWCILFSAPPDAASPPKCFFFDASEKNCGKASLNFS